MSFRLLTHFGKCSTSSFPSTSTSLLKCPGYANFLWLLSPTNLSLSGRDCSMLQTVILEQFSFFLQTFLTFSLQINWPVVTKNGKNYKSLLVQVVRRIKSKIFVCTTTILSDFFGWSVGEMTACEYLSFLPGSERDGRNEFSSFLKFLSNGNACCARKVNRERHFILFFLKKSASIRDQNMRKMLRPSFVPFT